MISLDKISAKNNSSSRATASFLSSRPTANFLSSRPEQIRSQSERICAAEGPRPELPPLRNTRTTTRARRSRQRGFTLIELLIVISIILILVGIAAGNYQRSILRSKETVLKQDLQEMRKAIDNYTMDKQAAPQTIDDLAPQYLHAIPVDPITNAKDWVPVVDNVVLTPDQSSSGVTDVHSASEKVSPFEGTAYSSW